MAVNVEQSTETTVGTKVRNLLIVLVAVALSVALFLGLRTDSSAVSLTSLAGTFVSVPLPRTALSSATASSSL